ncbi:hypothetical protein ACFPM3_11735 [Streptomyces coeruleoprunus]|uniref:Uncharacterized protein n=1 Tax=Streptomyces coeruleoprunus TaxID=285563 RepID=A0ABV9XBH8_9ACTN
MRPARFVEFVIGVVKNRSTASHVQTLADAGDTKHPYGVVVTTDREVRWQFLGQLPEGAKHENFSDDPVTGAPAAGDAPQPGEGPEGWMAATLLQAEHPEIAVVERWSTQQGMTITFHNGARIFARVM